MKANAGNGDFIGPVLVSPGTYTVDETAATGTDPDEYDTTINCGGRLIRGISTSVTLSPRDLKTCVITNTSILDISDPKVEACFDDLKQCIDDVNRNVPGHLTKARCVMNFRQCLRKP